MNTLRCFEFMFVIDGMFHIQEAKYRIHACSDMVWSRFSSECSSLCSPLVVVCFLDATSGFSRNTRSLRKCGGTRGRVRSTRKASDAVAKTPYAPFLVLELLTHCLVCARFLYPYFAISFFWNSSCNNMYVLTYVWVRISSAREVAVSESDPSICSFRAVRLRFARLRLQFRSPGLSIRTISY